MIFAWIEEHMVSSGISSSLHISFHFYEYKNSLFFKKIIKEIQLYKLKKNWIAKFNKLFLVLILYN